MFKDPNKTGPALRFFHFCDLNFVPSFEIVSNFDILISDFRVSGKWVNRKHSSRISNCHFWGQNL